MIRFVKPAGDYGESFIGFGPAMTGEPAQGEIAGIADGGVPGALSEHSLRRREGT